MLSLLVILAVPAQPEVSPTWRTLPVVTPVGNRAHTGSYIDPKRAESSWSPPPFTYNARAATGRKLARVLILNYDPILNELGGKSLREEVRGIDPEEASRILVDVVRQASWGYINYEIAGVINVNGFPAKVDGFRYDSRSYLEARKAGQWHPAMISYRRVFEDNGLIDRCRREGITEVWLWGADGMHIDEFAGYIPNRYARFAPTDNPWLYRPYDIPEELGRTTWVMGFNYQVGPDNMLHSYVHRVESMVTLAIAQGIWESKSRGDPWNLFSRSAGDHPGGPVHVGNAHFPPNAREGYDYANSLAVPSLADRWWRYPDLRGPAMPISAQAWGGNQFGYQKWLLERLPKGPGATRYGYNNWWLYVANTDEELPELPSIEEGVFHAPEAPRQPTD